MSSSTPSSVCACSVTTHGIGIRVVTTRARSAWPIEQTSHTDCPISTSGRRWATSWTSTSTVAVPARFASTTARSIAPEGSAESMRLRVTRGSERTWGGKSHSCETPTSRPIAPSAATISVAAGSNDTMRMPII